MVEDVRTCDQCGAEFEPRREHARFCSAVCRIAWNRDNASGQAIGDTPLTWSVAALEDAASRLCKAEGMTLPEALAVISEAVWWVTLVDATMIRYHHDAYDRALTGLPGGERKVTEGTFAGLRYVRNCMGIYVDPADFVQPERDSLGGDAPVPAWTWREVPVPVPATLPQRARAWETRRYQYYRRYIAGQRLGETVNRAARFLTQLAAAL